MTDVFANGVINVEAFGPADKSTFIDAKLLDREAEGEAELEKVLFAVLLAFCSALVVFLEMFVVVGFEKRFNLGGEKGEKVVRVRGSHEGARNGDFRLSERKCSVAI